MIIHDVYIVHIVYIYDSIHNEYHIMPYQTVSYYIVLDRAATHFMYQMTLHSMLWCHVITIKVYLTVTGFYIILLECFI